MTEATHQPTINQEYQEVTLLSINNGAALELFQEEFQKVMRNINDLSVNSDKPREIVMKFKIKPSKDRQTATTTITTTTKLASVKEHESAILITQRGAYAHKGRQLDFMDHKQQA